MAGFVLARRLTRGPASRCSFRYERLQHRGEEVVVVGGHLGARASVARITVDTGPDSVFHRLGATRWGFLLTDLRLVIGRPVRKGRAGH